MLKLSLLFLFLLHINAFFGVMMSTGDPLTPFVDFETAKGNRGEVSWPVSLKSMMLTLINLSTQEDGRGYFGNNTFRLEVFKLNKNKMSESQATYLKDLLLNKNCDDVDDENYSKLEGFSQEMIDAISKSLIAFVKEYDKSENSSDLTPVSFGEKTHTLSFGEIDANDQAYMFYPGYTIYSEDSIGNLKAIKNIKKITES